MANVDWRTRRPSGTEPHLTARSLAVAVVLSLFALGAGMYDHWAASAPFQIGESYTVANYGSVCTTITELKRADAAPNTPQSGCVAVNQGAHVSVLDKHEAFVKVRVSAPDFAADKFVGWLDAANLAGTQD